MANVIDFNSAKARRNAKHAAELALRERILHGLNPYTSMDDLPDIVTADGHAAIREHVCKP